MNTKIPTKKNHLCVPIKGQEFANDTSISNLLTAMENGSGVVPFNLEQDLYNELVAYYQVNSGNKPIIDIKHGYYGFKHTYSQT